MKSRIAIILVFSVLLGAIGWVGVIRAQWSVEPDASNPIPPAPVRCALLEPIPYRVTESFYGLIEADTRVDVSFQIAGRVMQLGPDPEAKLVENHRVQKGDVIAKLEPLRYEAAMEQSRAAMDQAKASMATAQALIDRTRVRYEDAQQEVERYEKLQRRQAANEREVEKARVELNMARADLDSAQAQMAAAHAAYSAARAESAMAGVNLQDSVLLAPLDASVAAVHVEVGQMVTPAQPIVTLVDLSKTKLNLGVVERKLPLLRVGQKVTVEVRALMAQSKLLGDSQALARPRNGFIAVIPPAADPATGLFHVEVELDNNDGLLRPGMIGKATVDVMEKTVYAVPAEAAVRSGDRAWAFFVDTGLRAGLDLGPVGKVKVDIPATVARRVWFEPFAFDKDYYLLTEPPRGLTQLVIEGQNHLSDGQAVRSVSGLASVNPDAG